RSGPQSSSPPLRAHSQDQDECSDFEQTLGLGSEQLLERHSPGNTAGGLARLMPPCPVAATTGRGPRTASAATYKITRALASPAARSSSLGARPASFRPSRARAAVSVSRDTVQDFFPAPCLG
ncbi:unnamed protein product, partial [Laminaria digitata]